MLQYHQDILRRLRVELIKNIYIDNHLLDFLDARRIITTRERQNIKASGDGVGLLLDILPKKGDHVFDDFCEALKEDEQESVVETLRQAERCDILKEEKANGGLDTPEKYKAPYDQGILVDYSKHWQELKDEIRRIKLQLRDTRGGTRDDVQLLKEEIERLQQALEEERGKQKTNVSPQEEKLKPPQPRLAPFIKLYSALTTEHTSRYHVAGGSTTSASVDARTVHLHSDKRHSSGKQDNPSMTSMKVDKSSVPVDVAVGLYMMGGLTDEQVTKEVIMSRIEGDGQLSPLALVTQMPEERHSAGVAIVGGLVYVAGGMTAGDQVHRTLWRYNPADNTWQQLSTMAQPRSRFPLLGLSDCVVAVGGVTRWHGKFNFGYVHGNECEMYDIKSEQWKKMTSLPALVLAIGGCVATDGNIYVSGGSLFFPTYQLVYMKLSGKGKSTSPRVFMYDSYDAKWQDRPSLLHARQGHVMVSWQDSLLVLGGSDWIDGVWVNILTTEMFNMATQQWLGLTSPLTQGRVFSGGVVYGNRVYIVGGYSNNSDGETVSMHNTVLCLDTNKLWKNLPATLTKYVSNLMACLLPLDSSI